MNYNYYEIIIGGEIIIFNECIFIFLKKQIPSHFCGSLARAYCPQRQIRATGMFFKNHPIV